MYNDFIIKGKKLKTAAITISNKAKTRIQTTPTLAKLHCFHVLGMGIDNTNLAILEAVSGLYSLL